MMRRIDLNWAGLGNQQQVAYTTIPNFQFISGKGKGREILSPMPGLDLEQRELSEDERPERKTRSQTKGKAREKRVKVRLCDGMTHSCLT